MTHTIALEPPPGMPSVIPTDGITAVGAPVGTDWRAVAIGTGPNVEAFPAYWNDPLLGSGNLPGIAISSFNNRALRQGTFVATGMCLWISGQIQKYIYDDGNLNNWISEWQNALAAYVGTLIPPGPDLGAYLPLAGGTMGGNINFQSGITTVLANNTYYQALDSGGQARGLIIKNNNNDITINDGTAAHVVIANQPVANNNYSWSGKDSTGNIHPVIGLLSDNAIHIGSSATTDIYFDETNAVHHAGNFILANNRYVMGNDSGGTARQLVGMSTANAFMVGSGVTGETDIYCGGSSWIYLRNQTNALGILTVNGYTYMNGRGRAYVAGGNDPFQVLSDNGYYARIQYVVSGTRQWSSGVWNSGIWGVSDDSGGATRFQIDTGGTATFFNTCNINGSSTIGGNLQVNGSMNANGNMSCSNTGYVYNQLQVWNSIVVNSGNAYFGGGSVNCGYVSCGGGIVGTNITDNGSTQVNGNFHCNNDVNANTCTFNHIQCNGDETVNGNFNTGGSISSGNHLSVPNGFCMGSGGAYNFDYTLGFPVANHAQWAGGLGVYAQFFGAYSDAELKRNIGPVEHDALAAIKPLRFYSYDVPRVTPDGEVTDERSHVAHGILAQQMQESLPGAVVSTDQPVKFVMDHTALETGGFAACEFETQPVLAVDLLTMLTYSLRAIQQLTDRLEQLEGRA